LQKDSAASQGGKHTQRESSPAGRNLPGKFLRGGGEIVAIVTVIELGFIGIIIIITIATNTFITIITMPSRSNILG
jgi:hypothetical protein